jgi:beta-galactosidase
VQVPSVWQTNDWGGPVYDHCQYTNIRYPFPFDPPFVPDANPCGLYKRSFEVSEEVLASGHRVYLNFDGVDSCFYLYINGEYCGYSQVAHGISEFDITSRIKAGVNRIAVLNLKWCDGSYLEDQDKFRHSGIFRDVYLTERPENYIRDFFVHTEIKKYNEDEDYSADASIRVDIDWHGAAQKYKARLYDAEGGELALCESDGSAAPLFTLPKAQLWSAETPYLYTLTLETEAECILQRIGVREVRIDHEKAADGRTVGVIKINNRHLMLNGVNRHDSDPVTGPAISRYQALIDLFIMKEHNVNAVRTSHYPNSPWFPAYCDALGLYMVAEADLESHGATNLISNLPIYAESYMDRQQRNVHRDKNHPAILIWSMGNECGYGVTFVEPARWIKQYDPSRLLHYESVAWVDKEHYDTPIEMFDVYSRMYPRPVDVEAYCRDGKELTNGAQPLPDGSYRPMILCEYIHAMGNGPGGAEDYYKTLEKYPNYSGGFVWEWCDHAVYMGRSVEGKKKYYYGGDFGEFPHDGNFCMDGLVYPDRRVSNGLLEYKQVCRPVRASLAGLKDGSIGVSLKNLWRFSSLKDRIEVGWKVNLVSSEGCKTLKEGLFQPDNQPLEEKTYEIALGQLAGTAGRVYLDLEYRDEGNSLGQAQLIGTDQLLLQDYQAGAPSTGAAENVKLEETDTDYIISAEGFRYVFSKRTGLFSSLNYQQRQVLAKSMEFNIWRAPTDNDRNIRHTWQQRGYYHNFTKVYRVEASLEGGGVCIRCQAGLTAPVQPRILTIDAAWCISGDGAITCDFRVERHAKDDKDRESFLPRFGLRLFLPQEIEALRYEGHGPIESYWDKHEAAPFGSYLSQVGAEHEDYLKPQENGSHWDCDSLELGCARTGGLRVMRRGEAFSFNASHYTQEELTEKQHSFEIEKSPWTVLCLDHTQSGLGTNSCGPLPEKEYRLDALKFEFKIKLVPFN